VRRQELLEVSRFGQDFLGVGLGLRREHFETLWSHIDEQPGSGVARRSAGAIDFVEVLTENALRESLDADGQRAGFVPFGGRTALALDRAARALPTVLHGVSLSVGGLDPLDLPFVEATDALGEALHARWFSDHLCMSAAHGIELHDLLPLPFTDEAVAHVSARIRQLQAHAKLPFLLENPSYYLDAWHPHHREMDEATFLARILQDSDCGLLLDVNNVYVNATNHGYDPRRFIDALPLDRVAQIHLAGHLSESFTTASGATETLLIDTHSRPVATPVLDLYAHVLERTGPVSTLLEWDHDIPDLDRMIDELVPIRAIMQRVTGVTGVTRP
jgi:hypothetical protein